MKINYSNGNSEIHGDFDKLEKLVKELGKDYYVDVGIVGPEGKEMHEDSGLTVAGIGAVHEFGSRDGKIPARSFIVKPLMDHQKEIDEATRKDAAILLEKGEVKRVFKSLGLHCENQMQAAFDTSGDGAWRPLSENYKVRPSGQPVTEGSQPLLDTGELRRAIASKVGGG
jgi:hypothetical protein